jgi:hypothetical protein
MQLRRHNVAKPGPSAESRLERSVTISVTFSATRMVHDHESPVHFSLGRAFRPGRPRLATERVPWRRNLVLELAGPENRKKVELARTLRSGARTGEPSQRRSIRWPVLGDP